MEQHLPPEQIQTVHTKGNALQPHCQTKHNRPGKTAIMGTPQAEIKQERGRRTSGAPQPDSTAILSFCSDYEKRPPYSFPKNRIRNRNCLPIFSGGLTYLPLKSEQIGSLFYFGIPSLDISKILFTFVVNHPRWIQTNANFTKTNEISSVHSCSNL